MLQLSNGSFYLVLAVLAILMRCAAAAVVATAARRALASGAALMAPPSRARRSCRRRRLPSLLAHSGPIPMQQHMESPPARRRPTRPLALAAWSNLFVSSSGSAARHSHACVAGTTGHNRLCQHGHQYVNCQLRWLPSRPKTQTVLWQLILGPRICA